MGEDNRAKPGGMGAVEQRGSVKGSGPPASAAFERDEQAEKNVTHHVAPEPELPVDQQRIFAEGLQILNDLDVPYMVGAAFARHSYTGIWRTTKDLDVFIKAADLRKIMDAFEEAGYETEVTSPHWLAKARQGDNFIDLIFGTGHGHLSVDDSWFQNRQPTSILGVPTYLIPVEEMIASAMFIASRHRFDGADVVHLIRTRQGEVNWQRLLDLLGDNWELLLWHLILFDFVYPGHIGYLPKELMVQLFGRVRARWTDPEGVENPRSFRGRVIDPFSFTVDVEDWGYEDKRKLEPVVNQRGEVL